MTCRARLFIFRRFFKLFAVLLMLCIGGAAMLFVVLDGCVFCRRRFQSLKRHAFTQYLLARFETVQRPYSRLLAGSALAALCAATAPAPAQSPTAVTATSPQTGRTNVLLIMADDLNSRTGFMGDNTAHTPHLDALARRGVIFQRAYCQYPVCNPSRNSLLTGLRPDTTRILDNSTSIRQTRPDVVTLPQLFRQNGYFTAQVSKVFHISQWDPPAPNEKTWKLDDPLAWDFRINTKPTELGASGSRLDLPGNPDVSREQSNAAFTGKEIEVKSENPLMPPSGGLNYRLSAHGDDEDQDDGQAAREAIKLLEQNQQRPFFIAVGFRRPHAAWIAPKKYFDLYPLDKIKVPPAASREGVPPLAFTNAAPHYGNNPENMRSFAQAYLASVSFLDAQVGKVVGAVDRLGLAQNTVIVFVSDHGFHLGEHGLWHKSTLFEEATRAPLVIAAPRMAGNGQNTRRIVEFVDIFPTVAQLAGLKTPPNLEGRSLVPLLHNPAARWSHPAWSQVVRTVRGEKIMGRSLRTERWRYSEWDEGRHGVELYDIENDPLETRNLANESKRAKVVSALQKQLRAQFQQRRETP